MGPSRGVAVTTLSKKKGPVVKSGGDVRRIVEVRLDTRRGVRPLHALLEFLVGGTRTADAGKGENGATERVAVAVSCADSTCFVTVLDSSNRLVR